MSMSRAELVERARARAVRTFSPRRLLRRIAFRVNAYTARRLDQPYVERDAVGPVNIQVKLARQASGGPFEPPEILLVNHAAAACAGGATRILEIGCGTGMFATSVVNRYADAMVTASEMDVETLRWTQAHRSHPRITYCRKALEEFPDDAFDLVVAIEVIEHVKDYAALLRQLARVAPRAIVTTPNRNRSAFDAVVSPPMFSEHVREWTAGEFYWVLRTFWSSVDLLTLPRFHRQVAKLRADAGCAPLLAPAAFSDTEEPLLAQCRRAPAKD